MRVLSIDQARRIALGAQGFCDPAPGGRVDRRHLRRVMGRINLLQLDSVQALARSHYLPHFSRLGPFDRTVLDDMAAEGGEWIEAWAHQASVVPMGDEPRLRWTKQRVLDGATRSHLGKLMRRNHRYVDDVFAEVEAGGPLRARDLSDPRPSKGTWWDSRSLGTWALDWLYLTGRLGVTRDANFHRTYDLYERIVTPEVRAIATPDPSDAQRELLMRSAAAHGVGTADDLADYYRMNITEARATLADLADEGSLELVEVEGWSQPAYLDPHARRPRHVERAALLSPFDPIVWHRDRAERLFGFAYRIEIYVPKPKRVYGYYVLPFLMGDRLVARVDLKTDREAATLRVLGAFSEPGADATAVATALRLEVVRLADHLDLDEAVVDPAGRGDLIAPLR